MSKKVWNGKIEKDEFIQLQESSAQVMGLNKEEVEEYRAKSSNDVQEARKWWNSLSTNEQNDLVKKYYSMWDYYGLSKAHEIVSSSSKRLIHIWKKTTGMTNEQIRKESSNDVQEYEVHGGGLAKPIKVKAKDKTDALKQAQDQLRTIFGRVPKSHFNVKAVKSKSKSEANDGNGGSAKKMNNVEKLRLMKRLEDVRGAMGSNDEEDTRYDDDINSMSADELTAKIAQWEIGDGSWWNMLKHIYDRLNES